MGRLDKVVSSAATGGGLRTRNRVTNKTRLKVIDGDVEDAELVFLEEDSDKNKVLDTAGVEHEDAKVCGHQLRSWTDLLPAPSQMPDTPLFPLFFIGCAIMSANSANSASSHIMVAMTRRLTGRAFGQRQVNRTRRRVDRL